MAVVTAVLLALPLGYVLGAAGDDDSSDSTSQSEKADSHDHGSDHSRLCQEIVEHNYKIAETTNRQYVEQAGPSSTNVFNVAWTAPASVSQLLYIRSPIRMIIAT